MKRYIAFDIGAESGRCVVGELGEGRLALTEVHRFSTPQIELQGHYHWHVLGIYQELEQGLELAVERFGNPFDGISVDTWGVDYVLLDADGRLLGYPYHYRDSRTDAMMDRAFGLVSREEIYEHTGIQFAQFNTLFQLRAEQVQTQSLLDVAHLLLPMPNYLLYLLSGVRKGEYTIVSTTQLSDPRRRTWSGELIRDFGFPQQIFPDVVEPGTVLGPVLPDLAAKTGIEPGTLVIASASHDTAAAVASIPATGDSWAFLSSGTWSLMGVERDDPLINEDALALNFTNEGGVSGKIRLLKNIMGLWPLQECRRTWEAEGRGCSYAELERQAGEVVSTGAWIDVDRPQFLKPGDMPAKIIAFLQETGQSYKEDIPWLTRCVLESLAFKYRTTMTDLKQLTGQSIDRLHAVGGGIQNTLLTQMTADALDREVVAGPVEGAAAGNIGVQAMATGAVSGLAAFRRIVAESSELTTYQPRQPDYWATHEATYRAILVN